MKHLKTFESFTTNETLDMMTMPVDPIKGAADMYGDVKDYLKDKFNAFEEKVEEFVDGIVEQLDADKVLSNIEKYFGKPAHDLSFKDIKLALERHNESSFADKYDAADPYGDEYLGSGLKDIKGGPAQKILHILQTIVGVNLLTFGIAGSFIAGIAGLLVGPGMSMILSCVAFIVLHIIRKLIAMI